ncbi:MAG: hypothetical protein ABJM06_06200 [Gilvibacter sp.]
METKLAHITTQYRRFTKNQVLTESHLNEVLDYFDDQIRLSRICLDGVGIACGFNLDCQGEDVLEVSQGSGVTTDGDLFQLYRLDEDNNRVLVQEPVRFTHYKPYVQEADKVLYTPYFFEDEDDIDSQILLLELLTSGDDDDALPISDMGEDQGLTLKNGVVVLYLENYLKEKDLCVSLSCDNQGDDIVGNYKMLLTSKAGATHLKDLDKTLSATNYEKLCYSLPEVFHNRAVMLKEDFVNYPTLRNKFISETLKNDMINRVKTGYKILMDAMRLSELYNDVVAIKIDQLFSFGIDDDLPDFQYRYDLLKDLIDTYAEIQTVLKLAEATHCCANLTDFPKHLMLGEVDKDQDCYRYRHGFYKAAANVAGTSDICGNCDPAEATTTSPFTLEEDVIDFEAANLSVCYSKDDFTQHIKSLVKRAILMLDNYNCNYTFIKATPSYLLGPLSNKAIPFYFNVGNQLIASWNFEKTVANDQRNNLSYHDGFLRIKSPLKFNIDHNFYRIEGHQGMNYLDAVSILTELKRENAISFNVVALPINATEAQPIIENYTSYYLTRNIGLDHKAGVVPGGTFVMIYIEGEYDEFPYPYGYGYPYGYPEDGAVLGSDFEVLPAVEGEGVLNPIVADFMLPYLCCDQNFAELTLPTDFICFNDDTQPLPFDVSPDGGFVSADVAIGLNGGVVLNDAGSFEFDPTLVSPELYGVPIKFKVNNLETECEITIQQQITFQVNEANIDYDRDSNTATVTFELTGDQIPSEQEFIWDFGDGTDKLMSTELSVDHVYNLELVGESGVLVAVQIENGDCSTQDTVAIAFDPIPTITIDSEEFCSADESPHRIAVIPDTATVVITGAGVGQVAGEWFFTPANVPNPPATVTFLIDGEDSGVTVRVEESPVASFTHEVTDTHLVLTNTSTITDRYEYIVDGVTFERAIRSVVNVPLENFNTDVIQVALRAISDLCGTNTFGPIDIEVGQGPVVDTCQDTATAIIDAAKIDFARIGADPEFSTLPPEAISLIDDLFPELYGDFEANMDDIFAGLINDNLPGIFDNDFFSLLVEARRKADTDFQVRVAQKCIELFAKLIYSMLNCQGDDTLIEFPDQIGGTLKLFTSALTVLNLEALSVDDEGNTVTFITPLSERFSDIPFIITEITSQLEQL